MGIFHFETFVRLMAGKRGQKKVLKRTNAPKSYGLTKLGGVFAIKPMAGAHNKNTSICLSYLLRYNLKYAENNKEVAGILKKRIVTVNGKVITNDKFAVGLMDILAIGEKEKYMVSFDSMGRFCTLPLKKNFKNIRLLKVTQKYTDTGKVPVIHTHDGANYRYAHPSIKVNDTVVYDMKKGKITEIYPFQAKQTVIAICGNNSGRVGTIVNIDSSCGGHKTVSVRDSNQNTFITKIENIMVVGDSNGPICEMHRDKGIRLTHVERRAKILGEEATMGVVEC